MQVIQIWPVQVSARNVIFFKYLHFFEKTIEKGGVWVGQVEDNKLKINLSLDTRLNI